MGRIVRHGRIKRDLDAQTLAVLEAFTAMQNRLPVLFPRLATGSGFAALAEGTVKRRFMGWLGLQLRRWCPGGTSQVLAGLTLQ
jgi:hypothetical protein